ncbi:hypothetical protein ACFRQM_24545 [Streptomyces sp. NPDC056831]|uniref:hypothetical protein n=1 Tax=Streptomyces sp. NPDC056831 TaxID=3345954 RepID=UPI00368F0B32
MRAAQRVSSCSSSGTVSGTSRPDRGPTGVGLALHPGGELVALAGVLGLVLRLLDGGCGCVVVGHDAALC